MAQFEVIEDEGVRFVRATLQDETIQAVRGALCYLSGNIHIDAKLPSLGWLIKSALSEESLIRPTYTGSGTLYLESSFAGFHLFEMDDRAWILQRGTYWASEGSVKLGVTQEHMMTSLWMGEGLFEFATKVTGTGTVVLTCEGPVERIELNNEALVADGKFVLARTEGITYRARRAAKSYFRSRLTGESRVRRYEGTGTLLVSSYPFWRYRMMQNKAGKPGQELLHE